MKRLRNMTVREPHTNRRHKVQRSYQGPPPLPAHPWTYTGPRINWSDNTLVCNPQVMNSGR